MKSKLTYLVVLIAVAVLYTGCGSDTVTGGNNNSGNGYIDTIVYSQSDLIFMGMPSLQVHTLYEDSANVYKKFRLQASVYSGSTANGFEVHRKTVMGSYVPADTSMYPTPMGWTNYDVTFSFPNDTVPNACGFRFLMNVPYSNDTLRFTNLKLWKLAQ